jgi:hypothetical protein
LLVIDGNAAARCGTYEGIDIVVKDGRASSAFTAQAGNCVLGDTATHSAIRSTRAPRHVRGSVKSLGADCIAKPLRDQHKGELHRLLDAAGLGNQVDVGDFHRYGSARRLYHFHIDNVGSY